MKPEHRNGIAVEALGSRTRKPVCGIWSWLILVLSLPVGLLLGYLASLGDHQGFEAWDILAWAFMPLLFALCVSPLIAIAALCRREKHPGVPASLLIVYGLSLALYAWGKHEMPLPIIAEVLLLATWLVRRRRKTRPATEDRGSASRMTPGEPIAFEARRVPMEMHARAVSDADANPATAASKPRLPRRRMQIALGLSLAYTAFVWFLAINALGWDVNENWAAVYAAGLGMLGLPIQFIVAAIVTGYAVTRKMKVYTWLPRTGDIVAVQIGWFLTTVAAVLAFCA